MTKPAWYPEKENEKLLLDFILWFSRIEYALKSSAKFSNAICGNFQADWDKFQTELQEHSIPSELKEALQYLKTKPPMKQKKYK